MLIQKQLQNYSEIDAFLSKLFPSHSFFIYNPTYKPPFYWENTEKLIQNLDCISLMAVEAFEIKFK